MGEGTAKKSFRVLDRNSDDCFFFFFSTFIWQMVRLHFGQAVNGMMISNVCGKNKYICQMPCLTLITTHLSTAE